MRALFCVFGLALVLAACGGGGGGSVTPPGGGNGGGNPTPSSSSSPGATPTPKSTSTPSGTPTPLTTSTPTPPTPTPNGNPTAYPSPPYVIQDRNPSTANVYVGELCGSNIAYITCAQQYAPMYYHSLSMENTFSNWQTDMGKFLQGNQVQLWGVPNASSQIVPMVTWEPFNVNYTDIIAGSWDNYITTSAQALAAFKYPIFLRPFHEFNGSWDSWSLSHQGANSQADANFIAAWQHMYNIIHPIAPNVRFVWCYANDSVPKQPWNEPAAAYPGDAYVDWIAFDAFNRGSLGGLPWIYFPNLIQDSYNKAIAISTSKPIMLAEIATNEWSSSDNGARKAAWITDMLNEIQTKFTNIRAFNYFDASSSSGQHPYTYALNSSPAVFQAWVQGIRPIDKNGVLLFRGNGEPEAQVTTAH